MAISIGAFVQSDIIANFTHSLRRSWDLNMGQRGQLDRITLAHNGPILALDWKLPATYSSNSSQRPSGSSGAPQSGNWYAGVGSGLFDDLGTNPVPEGDVQGNGWLASGGLDRTVKVWDITVPGGGTHIPRRPAYVLHTAGPVRRVAWRPGADCELAVTPYLEGSANTQANPALDITAGGGAPGSPRIGAAVPPVLTSTDDGKALCSRVGDPVEVWDVRRGYIAKWTVRGSAVEGGVTGVSACRAPLYPLMSFAHPRYCIRGYQYPLGGTLLRDVLPAGLTPICQSSRCRPARGAVVGYYGFARVCHRPAKTMGSAL